MPIDFIAMNNLEVALNHPLDPYVQQAEYGDPMIAFSDIRSTLHSWHRESDQTTATVAADVVSLYELSIPTTPDTRLLNHLLNRRLAEHAASVDDEQLLTMCAPHTGAHRPTLLAGWASSVTSGRYSTEQFEAFCASMKPAEEVYGVLPAYDTALQIIAESRLAVDALCIARLSVAPEGETFRRNMSPIPTEVRGHQDVEEEVAALNRLLLHSGDLQAAVELGIADFYVAQYTPDSIPGESVALLWQQAAGFHGETAQIRALAVLAYLDKTPRTAENCRAVLNAAVRRRAEQDAPDNQCSPDAFFSDNERVFLLQEVPQALGTIVDIRSELGHFLGLTRPVYSSGKFIRSIQDNSLPIDTVLDNHYADYRRMLADVLAQEQPSHNQIEHLFIQSLGFWRLLTYGDDAHYHGGISWRPNGESPDDSGVSYPAMLTNLGSLIDALKLIELGEGNHLPRDDGADEELAAV